MTKQSVAADETPRLRADNERLRAALELAASRLDRFGFHNSVVDARAALKGGQDD